MSEVGCAVADDIVTRLRDACRTSMFDWSHWPTPHESLVTQAADEIERLRTMAYSMIDELRQNGGYEAYTPKMLFKEFYKEASRD